MVPALLPLFTVKTRWTVRSHPRKIKAAKCEGSQNFGEGGAMAAGIILATVVPLLALAGLLLLGRSGRRLAGN